MTTTEEMRYQVVFGIYQLHGQERELKSISVIIDFLSTVNSKHIITSRRLCIHFNFLYNYSLQVTVVTAAIQRLGVDPVAAIKMRPKKKVKRTIKKKPTMKKG